MARPSSDASERAMLASIASNVRWANERDRSAATAPARRAFADRFEREVDPDGVLPADERARRAVNARKAFYARLALASARARRRKAGSA
jgi:hypothetical protein